MIRVALAVGAFLIGKYFLTSEEDNKKVEKVKKKQSKKRGKRKMYRTKNYVAFDGDESYMSYLNLLRWSNTSDCAFTLNNAHDVNTANDDSLPDSIKNQLRERLNKSKNMVLIIDKAIKYNRKGIVKYEINYALRNKLPIILVFKGYSSTDSNTKKLWNEELLPLIPKYLRETPETDKYCLISPFTIAKINTAVNYTHNNLPSSGYTWHWR